MSEIKVGGMLTADEILVQMKAGKIVIHGFDIKNLNPNSYNVTLGNKLLKYVDLPIDPKKENRTEEVIIPEEGLIINPGDFYLGFTNEYVESHAHIPSLSGRSSVGRLSIAVHQTAGFGDIGHCGRWTLEMFTILPTIIYPNMPIGQIYWFEPLGSFEDKKYVGKYQGAKDVQASSMYKDFSAAVAVKD